MLCALGREASLEECERVCKVSATDGTSVRNLITGARAMGLRLISEIKESRDDIAHLLLDKWLSLGMAAILIVDEGGHWVAAVGKIGVRTLIADSGESELVLSLTPRELADRWDSGGKKKFYAAILGGAQ